MINKWHAVYPSSNLPLRSIKAYGWEYLEAVPSRVCPDGQLRPTEEASVYLRQLRDVIDDRQTLRLQTPDTLIVIEDFAVAVPRDGNSASQLGFFVLNPQQKAEALRP